MNSLGFEKNDIASFEKTGGVEAAEGSVSCDVLFTPDKSADKLSSSTLFPRKSNT